MLNTPVLPSTLPRNAGCQFYTARALPDGERRRPVEAISIEAAAKWFGRHYPQSDFEVALCHVKIENDDLAPSEILRETRSLTAQPQKLTPERLAHIREWLRKAHKEQTT